MARYLLIDTKTLHQGEIDEAMHVLEKNKCVLSEEETMEKFRDCFDAGFNHCTEQWGEDEYGAGFKPENAKTPSFEQYAKENL